MTKKISSRFLFITLLTCAVILTSCGLGAGTLGGFDSITFATSKPKLVIAIDSLFANYPEYKIPDKWKTSDDWKARGYDFLDSRIFYFKNQPEEMYYVSFIGDANDSMQIDNTSTSIAIRAIDNGGTYSWTLEKNLSAIEKKRIVDRFNNEIISKLEKYTNSKVISTQ